MGDVVQFPPKASFEVHPESLEHGQGFACQKCLCISFVLRLCGCVQCAHCGEAMNNLLIQVIVDVGPSPAG